jgi:hypothetical protein
VTTVVLNKPLSPKECAALAGMHYSTILRRIRAGDLRAFQPAGSTEYVVDPDDFKAWLYGRPVTPDAPDPHRAETRPARPPARGSLRALDEIEREGRVA